MAQQATQEWQGKILKRWIVTTDRGDKIAWRETAEEARALAERHGDIVRKVRPAKSAAD